MFRRLCWCLVSRPNGELARQGVQSDGATEEAYTFTTLSWRNASAHTLSVHFDCTLFVHFDLGRHFGGHFSYTLPDTFRTLFVHFGCTLFVHFACISRKKVTNTLHTRTTDTLPYTLTLGLA